MPDDKINFYLFLMLLVSFIPLFVTGVIKLLVVLRIFGIDFVIPLGVITLVHDWSGLIFCVLVIFHIIIHLDWIKKKVVKKI